MYEKNNAQRKPKNNAPMIVCLVACVAAMVVAVGLFVWSWYYQLSYRDFVSDFSDSTYYAYRRQTLLVEKDGMHYGILKDNILSFYSAITSRGSGRLRRVPDREPDAVLTFGDGAYIQLWTEEVKNLSGGKVEGLLVCFVNKEGEAYTYDSARLNLDILPIEKSENIPVINKVPHLPDD